YERQHHRHPERAQRVEGSSLLMLARVRSLDSLRSLEMTMGRGDEGGGFGRSDKGGRDGGHRHWVVPALVVLLRCMMVPQCGHRVGFHAP
ncbi:MAG: hypothetical protein ABF728_09365, partial [Bifidobacterium aquikefiri]